MHDQIQRNDMSDLTNISQAYCRWINRGRLMVEGLGLGLLLWLPHVEDVAGSYLLRFSETTMSNNTKGCDRKIMLWSYLQPSRQGKPSASSHEVHICQ